MACIREVWYAAYTVATGCQSLWPIVLIMPKMQHAPYLLAIRAAELLTVLGICCSLDEEIECHFHAQPEVSASAGLYYIDFILEFCNVVNSGQQHCIRYESLHFWAKFHKVDIVRNAESLQQAQKRILGNFPSRPVISNKLTIFNIHASCEETKQANKSYNAKSGPYVLHPIYY